MSADLTPNPEVWPVCAHVSHAGHGPAFVLRRTQTLGRGSAWMWMSDCPRSHRGTEPALRTADGLVPTDVVAVPQDGAA